MQTSFILLQAQAGSNYSMLILVFVLIALFLFFKKTKYIAISGFGFLSVCLIFGLLFQGFFKGNVSYPGYTWVTIQVITFIFLLVGIVYSLYTYNSIVQKKNKTEEDIIKRQKLISFVSYLMAISFTLLPFFMNSWGIGIIGSLESDYCTDEYVKIRFINNGMTVSLFISIVVFIADTILHRIASPIHTSNDIADINKFCLYLRSFNVDNNKEEKFICQVLKRLYPVYAIGNPNKVLQPNGAERIYVTDEIWQKTVKDLSNRSKLILLRIGQTDGTMWEITNIIDEGLFTKTIFVTYSNEDYVYFCKKVKDIKGITLPNMDFSDNLPIAFFFDY